jgi:hypothetical protein
VVCFYSSLVDILLIMEQNRKQQHKEAIERRRASSPEMVAAREREERYEAFLKGDPEEIERRKKEYEELTEKIQLMEPKEIEKHQTMEDFFYKKRNEKELELAGLSVEKRKQVRFWARNWLDDFYYWYSERLDESF